MNPEERLLSMDLEIKHLREMVEIGKDIRDLQCANDNTKIIIERYQREISQALKGLASDSLTLDRYGKKFARLDESIIDLYNKYEELRRELLEIKKSKG